MKKLIVTFRNFANSPNKVSLYRGYCYSSSTLIFTVSSDSKIHSSGRRAGTATSTRQLLVVSRTNTLFLEDAFPLHNTIYFTL